MEHQLKTLAQRRNLPLKYYVIAAVVIAAILAGLGLFLIIYHVTTNNNNLATYILLGVFLLVVAVLYAAIMIVRGLREQGTPTEAIVYDEDAGILVLVSKSGQQTAIKPETIVKTEIVDNEGILARFYGDTYTLLIQTNDGGEFHLPYIENYDEAASALNSFTSQAQ